MRRIQLRKSSMDKSLHKNSRIYIRVNLKEKINIFLIIWNITYFESKWKKKKKPITYYKTERIFSKKSSFCTNNILDMLQVCISRIGTTSTLLIAWLRCSNSTIFSRLVVLVKSNSLPLKVLLGQEDNCGVAEQPNRQHFQSNYPIAFSCKNSWP